MRLARAVRAEHRDAVAEPDLEVERPHQPGELEPLARRRRACRCGRRAAASTGPARAGAPRAGRPPRTCAGGSGGPVARREPVVLRRLHLQRRDELLQLGVLLVPAPAQLVEALHPLLARLVVRREAAAVHPGGVAGGAELERDDAVGGAGEQLAVVRDEQHGLRRRAQLALEPALAGHVEVVVGLVEQQHLLGSAQQRLEREPLLLAARERARARGTSPARTGCRAPPSCSGPRRSPARSRRPRRSRRARSRSASASSVSSRSMMRVLGRLELERRVAHAPRRDRDEQVVHRRRRARRRLPGADELVHHAEAAVDLRRCPRRAGSVAADDAQQRRLAGAVRADERGRATPRPRGTRPRRAAAGRRAARRRRR